MSLISLATADGSRGDFCVRETSSISAVSVSFASPSTASAQATSLLTSAASSVAWMMVLPLRHRDAVIRRREAAADAEDEVGFFQEMMHRRRNREAARAERQRVRLGERALALQAGGDRNREQFGELPQLAPRFRPMHALAGVKHRAFRGEQHLRGLADRVGIGTGAQRRETT